MPTVLTVKCDGCGKTIQLPRTTPPEKALRQLTFASVELPRNVLCPYCSRVFSYPIERFEIRQFEMQDQLKSLGDLVCVCIHTTCASSNCAALVRVFAAVNVSDDIKFHSLDVISQSVFATAVCQRGHRQIQKPQSGAFEVQLEPDWNPRSDSDLT